MKTIIASALLLAVALVASGCNLVPRAVESSATKFNVQTADGKSIIVELPKNMEVTNLDVQIDPTTGKYHIKVDKVSSDASGVLDSAGAVQAHALGKLADTVTTLAPLLALPRPPAPSAPVIEQPEPTVD